MGTAFLWIVIGTSLWMAFDAHQIGYDRSKVKGMAGMGPVGWLFAGLLLWIIAFPLYLASRSKLKAAAGEDDASAPARADSEAASQNEHVAEGERTPHASAEERKSSAARIGRGFVNTIYGLGALAVVFLVVASVMHNRVETTPDSVASSHAAASAAPPPSTSASREQSCRQLIQSFYDHGGANIMGSADRMGGAMMAYCDAEFSVFAECIDRWNRTSGGGNADCLFKTANYTALGRAWNRDNL